MELKEKTILVTGGGSGMGRELVLALLEKGCKIIAVDISEKGLKETFRLSGNSSRLFCRIADISDENVVKCLAKDLFYKGNIDIVINNAGIIQPFVRIEELAPDTARKLFDVNFWGTVNIIQSFLPHLKTRPEAQVVNISSMGGFLPIPGQAIYSASKAAVKMLSECLTAELKGSNVKVVTVFPGAMNTDIKKNSGIDDGSQAAEVGTGLQPDTAARMIISAMGKDTKAVYVGEDAKAMGLLCQMNPEKAAESVANMIHHKL